MRILSLDLLPTEILSDLFFVRDSIKDYGTYQRADVGIVLSNLDDIIDICQYAISQGYQKYILNKGNQRKGENTNE